MTRHRLVPALLVAAALLASCAGGGAGGHDAASHPPVKGVTTVVANQFSFSPAAIEVPAGTEVTWSFQDGLVSHDVEGDSWGSGEPQRSGTFRRTFDQPGTYDYVCTLHPQMTGRVAARAGP
jgi:plastocyanin